MVVRFHPRLMIFLEPVSINVLLLMLTITKTTLMQAQSLVKAWPKEQVVGGFQAVMLQMSAKSS